MPRRNILKSYVDGGCYHLYNRGVEKRDIFMDDKDYRVFLGYLKLYLSPPNTSKKEKEHVNLSEEIELISYCLMPNHFHFLVKQNNKDGISKFMKFINTRYVMYFNQRHDRVGGLYQSAYKAVLVDKDDYLMHLSRYIHLNPQGIRRKFDIYKYSSYQYYVSDKKAAWVKPEFVLDLFGSKEAYQEFVNDMTVNSKEEIGRIAID